ncbi:MAG TPA: hypothetical protein VGQ96_05395 [Candidatus Eremiobacteraceae bacterium]|nr:hypothetical protein [Candidatus Eremiobacteraceae bacterium]
MPPQAMVLSTDNQWRIDVVAFSTTVPFLYKRAGVRARSYHWEMKRWLFFPLGMGWVERAVPSLSVSAHFTGMPAAIGGTGVMDRTDDNNNVSDVSASIEKWGNASFYRRVANDPGSVDVNPIRDITAVSGSMLAGLASFEKLSAEVTWP